tara:strand:- start:858 stop:1169 length:312 start_codon:yes stop_codon:yes gene_type:complete
MLKTTLQKQTFTSEADGSKFTDHLTFEIVEDKDEPSTGRSNHQIKISMISQFDIVEFVCSLEKFSEAVGRCSTIDNLKENSSYSLQQQVKTLAENFRPINWDS